jgi:arylsulfatase A-like enzyme
LRTLSLFIFAGLTSLLACGGNAEKPEASAAAPNIIFVFTDDHGYQAISAYGSKVNKTPNMDRLATEGMRFDRCFVTNSICGPSRAVIQTGKHSHLNGFFQNGLSFNGDQQTFPKLLQKAGYQTAIIGKWHLKSVPQGFDTFDVLIGQGPYYNPPMRSNDGKGGVKVTRHTGYITDIITEKTMHWLKKTRDPNKPFMLMFQHKAPHRNWQPGPKHLTMYDGEDIPEPETLWDDYKNRASPASKQEMTIAKHLTRNDLKLTRQGRLNPEQRAAWKKAYDPKNKKFKEAKLTGRALVKWKYQRYVKDYLRCVAAVDDSLGILLDYLDESGLAKNTVVIYSSDQGWYLGEHGWYDKRWMYEESFRTPLMIRWPGVVQAGTVNKDFVSNLDFAQTFLDIAGVKQPKDMQGASMLPVLKGQTPKDWRKTMYYHYYEYPGAHAVRRHYGVRTQRHKLIYFYNEKEWELFDLDEDPNELMNIYHDKGNAKLIATMKKELARLRKLYKVPEVDPKKPARKNAQKKK